MRPVLTQHNPPEIKKPAPLMAAKAKENKKHQLNVLHTLIVPT